MFKEFKEFALRGNVMDLAIGVIIGAAFGKVVTALVSNVLMPPLGLALGNVDFKNLALKIGTDAAGKPINLEYGLFLNTIVDFVIIAFVIFLLVKGINRMSRKPAPPPPNTKECGFCITAVPIRATKCPACTSNLPA